MKHRLYELCWLVETDVRSFCYREFRVFRSKEEVRRYGKKREVELNNGMPIDERSQDGFYYKFMGSYEVKDVDGFTVILKYQ